MKTYFTADPHFSRHGTNLLGRPFANVREMSEHILDAINSRVTRKDRLIIAGDFSFREPAYWRSRLVCRNCVLVLGNHDNRAKSIEAFGIHNTREQYDTKCCGHPCWVSHYPTLYWPKSHYGSYHVFGHVHDQRTGTIIHHFPTARMMDVGVDAAYRELGEWTAFSEDEIHANLSLWSGHDPVEFYTRLRGEYNKDHVSESH